ncbi:MAG: uroporphyrinogen decarboxylase family protein [Eubacteriales bacterium]
MTSLKEQRNQLFRDIWEGKRPKRVPINVGVTQDFALDYLGYSPKIDMYSPKLTYEMADRMAQLIDGDNLPMAPFSQVAIYRYVKQAFMVPGADGFFQHPNIAPMEFEEYPELSKDPLKFIVEKIQPRVFGILQDDPEYGQLKISIARNVVASKFVGLGSNLSEKYQRADVVTSPIILWAPFDFIADYIRSFSTILTDIRRRPEWVLEACEAACEFEIKQAGMLPKPDPNKITTIQMPLHMAPYMKPKDFEKFYWPTYKKVVEEFQKLGFKVSTYAEEDWTPHLEAFNDLPGRCCIQFEKPLPSEVVKRVSTKHIFSTMYPSSLLREGTKHQCIDKAKEYLDILLPGGNYIFSPQKTPLRKNDVKMENLQAVIEFVREYGKY